MDKRKIRIFSLIILVVSAGCLGVLSFINFNNKNNENKRLENNEAISSFAEADKVNSANKSEFYTSLETAKQETNNTYAILKDSKYYKLFGNENEFDLKDPSETNIIVNDEDLSSIPVLDNDSSFVIFHDKGNIEIKKYNENFKSINLGYYLNFGSTFGVDGTLFILGMTQEFITEPYFNEISYLKNVESINDENPQNFFENSTWKLIGTHGFIGNINLNDIQIYLMENQTDTLEIDYYKDTEYKSISVDSKCIIYSSNSNEIYSLPCSKTHNNYFIIDTKDLENGLYGIYYPGSTNNSKKINLFFVNH